MLLCAFRGRGLAHRQHPEAASVGKRCPTNLFVTNTRNTVCAKYCRDNLWKERIEGCQNSLASEMGLKTSLYLSNHSVTTTSRYCPPSSARFSLMVAQIILPGLMAARTLGTMRSCQ